MLAIERLSEITKELQRRGTAKVEELAKQFGVSEMTIRRDLEKLEKDGVAYRCYGGAALKTDLINDVAFKDRETLFPDVKKRLAAYCHRNFTDGPHILYLDAGSTVLELAKLLVYQPSLTIITNDVIIASYLAGREFETIILGGKVQAGLGCVHGYVAEHQLAGLRIDAAFVSGLSIDKNYDLFAATENKVYFRRRLLEQSNKSYLLMDSSKFYKQSIFRTHNLSEYTAVLSDKVLSKEERSLVQQKGINWITVEAPGGAK